MPKSKDLDSFKQKDSVNVEKYSTFENFDENTHRVRRNLLIFSVIALFYKLSGATLGRKSSFFGLMFENVNPLWIDLFLLLIVIYHLIHFLWLAYEHFQHNIISLTRVGDKYHRDTVATGITLKDNSWNLYWWWNENIQQKIEIMLQQKTYQQNLSNESEKSETKLNELLLTYDTKQVFESLKKFDKYYKNYSLTNKLRWGIIEFGIPFLLGCSAIYFF